MELSVTFNLNNTRILFTGNFRPKKNNSSYFNIIN